MDGDEEETSRRVQVRFVTKLDPPYKAPITSIAIPSNLTRLGLSTIVNNLLEAGTFIQILVHNFQFHNGKGILIVSIVCSLESSK